MDGNLSCSSCWDSFGTLTLPGREIRVEDEEGNGPVMRVWASEREMLEEWRRWSGIFAGLFCVAMDCFLVTQRLHLGGGSASEPGGFSVHPSAPGGVTETGGQMSQRETMPFWSGTRHPYKDNPGSCPGPGTVLRALAMQGRCHNDKRISGQCHV